MRRSPNARRPLAAFRPTSDATQLMTEELRLEMVARATELPTCTTASPWSAAAKPLPQPRATALGEELVVEREQTHRSRSVSARWKRALPRCRRNVPAASPRSSAALHRSACWRAEIANLRASATRRRPNFRRPGRRWTRCASDIVDEGDNVRKAIAATEAHNTELNRRLAAMEDDFAALRAENADLRRVAGRGLGERTRGKPPASRAAQRNRGGRRPDQPDTRPGTPARCPTRRGRPNRSRLPPCSARCGTG